MRLRLLLTSLAVPCLGHAQIFTVPLTGLADAQSISSGVVGTHGSVVGLDDMEGRFYAFTTSYTGGANAAGGDVNGDGIRDMIVGANTGLDGTNPGSEIFSVFPFGAGYSGGVNVCTGVTQVAGGLTFIAAPLPHGLRDLAEQGNRHPVH